MHRLGVGAFEADSVLKAHTTELDSMLQRAERNPVELGKTQQGNEGCGTVILTSSVHQNLLEGLLIY